MSRPSRARRILKWTGLGLSLFILMVWIATLWFYANFGIPDHRVNLMFVGGKIIVLKFDPPVPNSVNRRGRHTFFGWIPVAPSYRWKQVANQGLTEIVIPYWLPLLLTAIPTAWVWHRNRRLISSSPDHPLCSGCGYDLMGNTSGLCPECGEKTTAKREETVESRK